MNPPTEENKRTTPVEGQEPSLGYSPGATLGKAKQRVTSVADSEILKLHKLLEANGYTVAAVGEARRMKLTQTVVDSAAMKESPHAKEFITVQVIKPAALKFPPPTHRPAS